MKKNIALIMIMTVIAKFFGFFRDIVLTYYYGASSITDAYLISQTIPTTIFSLIGAGLMTSFIPIYNKVRKERGNKGAMNFTSNLMNILFILASGIVLIVLFGTEPLVKLFASGFTGSTLALAVNYTRISVFGLYFTGVIYIMSSYLQIHNNFMIPSMIAIPSNIVVVLSIYYANRYDDRILAVGILASIVVQFLFLLPSAYKIHFKYRLVLDFKDKYLKEIILLSIPVIIGVSVNQLNILVDKNLASNIVIGGISVINYSDKLISVVQGIFVIPIVTVIYPRFSAMVVDKKEHELGKIINQSIIMVSLLIIPVTLGTMVLSKPIVDMLYLRGSFDEAAAIMTSGALFYYSIGLLFYAFRDVFSKVYYAFGDTKTPMINTTIGVIINIGLNFLLSRFMGISGLALATTISAIVTSLLMMKNLDGKLQGFLTRSEVKKLLKIFLASMIMAGAAYGIYLISMDYIGQNIALVVSVSIGSLLYFILINFLKIEEVTLLVHSIRNKFRRAKTN